MTHKLSDRVERLKGPDREIDALIFRALADAPAENHWYAYGGDYLSDGTAPKVTASLDAAMSLVPEGWSIGLGDLRGYDPIVWRAHLRDHNDPDAMKRKWFEGHAPTPAIALCAAALKARGL